MSPTVFFAFLGGLLALAFAANRLYRLTRVPDVIVLMAVGLVVGPVLGWIKAAEFEPITHILGTLALILILFEGGLELNLRDTLSHFPGGVMLAIVGYFVSMGLVAAVAWKGHMFALRPALLIGAVLGCVSSSIVLPILQQIKISRPVRLTLLIEASLGDVLGVLTVSVLLIVGGAGKAALTGFVAGLLSKLLVCVLAAAVIGWLWSRLLHILSEQRFWQVMTFAIVLLVYAAAQAASHGGLIAVLVFGLALANAPKKDPRFLASTRLDDVEPEHHLQILSFHSELAFLVRSFFFILLGVVVQISGLRGYALLTAGCLGALIAARWIAVKSSSWAWGEKDSREKQVALLLFPRGLITAVLAIEVIGARGDAFAFLPALAFAIILFTNVLAVIASVRAGPNAGEEPPRGLSGPAGDHEVARTAS
ncbi:MAG: cation:proton antiporter [Terriglobia bacterium]